MEVYFAKFQPYLLTQNKTKKGLPGTNILAYWPERLWQKKNVFTKLPPGANVTKLFFRNLRIFVIC